MRTNYDKATFRFQQFLKLKRKKAGMSQGEVAKSLGYSSPQFVSNWERGLASPPMQQILRLADLYSVSSEDIYTLMVEEALARLEKNLEEEYLTLKKRKPRTASLR